MRFQTYFAVLLSITTLLISGCAQTTSRQSLTDHMLRMQHDQFPDEAVYMGDADGYHYFKLRSIYSYLGDRDYKVPASDWNLPATFALTDDASRWQSVYWVDLDVLKRSRYGYVLLTPSEQVTAGPGSSFQMPDLYQPTTLPATNPSTEPATVPGTTNPSGTQ